MIMRTEGTLLNLTGGVQLKRRVQHPKVQECRDRETPYWFIRYWHDELSPDGTIKVTRKREIIGPSRRPNAIGKKEAETRRDTFMAKLNKAPSQCEAASEAKQPVEIRAILFGNLEQMWREDFVEREVGGRSLIAKSTRAKYINHLENHVIPRWKGTRLAEFKSKDVLDWLMTECDSWYMNGRLAQHHERNILEGPGLGNPAGHFRQPDAQGKTPPEVGSPGEAPAHGRGDRAGACTPRRPKPAHLRNPSGHWHPHLRGLSQACN